MTRARALLAVAALAAIVDAATALAESNLTCYQCVRHAVEECREDELLPCPSNKDRCVTHISKDDENGLVLKRECGLGPCSFDDREVRAGLGLEGCDRSKESYFCVFCCKHSGCNKDSSLTIHPSSFLIFAATILTVIMTILLQEAQLQRP